MTAACACVMAVSLAGMFFAPSTHAACSGTSCNIKYTPLEPVAPGEASTIQSPSDFPRVLNVFFNFLIALGAAIAVVTLTVGGVFYMTSDLIPVKDRARDRMTASVWGLLLLLVSWLILNTINPQLLNFNLDQLLNLKNLST